MKTSSPLDRKILLASPGLLANPKNFKLIGGGGGGGGGRLSFGASVTGEAIGLGISSSAVNILRPLPVYSMFSLDASSVNRSVGSREGGDGGFLSADPVECWFGRDGRVATAVGGFMTGAFAATCGEFPPHSDITRYPMARTARPPRIMAAMVFLRFSVPRFTYALVLK